MGVQLGVAGGSPACEQLGAGNQRVLHIVAHLHFDGGVVQPGNIGIFPAFHGDGPFAQLALHFGEFRFPRLGVAVFAACECDRPTVQTGVHAGHRRAQHLLAARIAYYSRGSDLGAPLDEYLRGDFERLPEFHTSGVNAVFLIRGDVHNIDAPELAGLGDGNNGGRRLARGHRGGRFGGSSLPCCGRGTFCRTGRSFRGRRCALLRCVLSGLRRHGSLLLATHQWFHSYCMCVLAKDVDESVDGRFPVCITCRNERREPRNVHNLQTELSTTRPAGGVPTTGGGKPSIALACSDSLVDIYSAWRPDGETTYVDVYIGGRAWAQMCDDT